MNTCTECGLRHGLATHAEWARRYSGRLVTKQRQVVYPHDFVIVDEKGEHWVMDSWDLDGRIWVVPTMVNRAAHRGKHQRRIHEFGLRVEALS